jgi:hypothetical protein
MKYQERAEIAPVESEWDDYFGKIEFGLDAYDKERVEGSLRLGLFVTTKDQEQWDYDNTGVYQTDDMDFRGADVNFNIGWAIADSSKYISFTPLINAGYRRIEFSRSNIGRPSSRAISQLGEVDEHFNVSFLGIGGKVDLALIESINIYGSGYWAPIVYTPTKNETLGSLDSNQGVIWHAEGGCDYALSDRFELGLGAFWDLQNIDRAQRIDNGIVSAELPDNKLTSIGLKLGGLYKF